MAVYRDKNTAMVIFAKASPMFDNVEAPNTINPNGSDIPFSPVNHNTPDISEVSRNNSFNYGTLKRAVVGLGLYNAVKSEASYYKNNYGDIMQDSNAQAEINETMNIVNMGLNIGMSFATGGPIAGIVAIGATGVKIGVQTATYQRQLHRNQIQSEIMMTRTQYASINGGR